MTTATHINLQSKIPPQPTAERSFTVHLSYNRAIQCIAYPSGKSAFVRYVGSEPNPDPSRIPSVVQFTGHANSNVTVVKFSPIEGSHYLVSGDESGKVIVWSWEISESSTLETKIKAEFQVLAGPITDISWDFEARRLCVVGEGRDKYGAFISWDSGNSLGEVAGHSSRVNACAIRPSRPMRCFTVGDDGAVVFYQGPPFKFQSSDRTHHSMGKFVRDVAFSPDSKYAVTVGSDRRICVFDGKTGEFVKFVEDTKDPVTGGLYALSWLDTERFVVCCADATVKVFDVGTASCLQSWTLPQATLNETQVGVVATSRDSFVSLSLDGTLNFFKLGMDKPVGPSIQGHNGAITSLAVNPMLTGSFDGTIMDWKLRHKLQAGHTNKVVSLYSGGYPAVTSIAWDDTLRVVNGDESKVVRFKAQPTYGCIDPKTGIAAVITSDDKLVLLDTAASTTDKIPISELPLGEPATAVYCNDHLVAIGYQNTKTVELFTRENPRGTITKDSDSFKLDASALRAAPSCISVSERGTYLAVGDATGKLLLFDLTIRQLKTSRWAFHTGRINSIAWRPGSEEDLVATGSLDTNICIYSVRRPMKVVKCLNAHKDGVNCVAWEDPQTVVSVGGDACVNTWSVTFDD